MKQRLVLLGAAIVAGLAGCQKEEAAPPPQGATHAAAPAQPAAPGAPQAGNLDEGKALFMRACGVCHGIDGTGNAMRAVMPKIGDLTSPELHTRMSDDQMLATISNGKDKMPPFQNALTPDQMKAVVKYVRTLKRAQ
jgi:mono/diheme cytochrome c family protein